jgi:sugar-specific transcriptional regulator TrmB
LLEDQQRIGEQLLTSYAWKPGFVRTPGDKWDMPRFVRKNVAVHRQIEIVESALVKYGLSESEVKTYLHLAFAGEKKASEIAEAISLHRTEVYRILRDLEKRGIVIETFEAPLKFTAIPLDKAVEQLVKAQRMKVNLLEKEKSELIQIWSSMPKPEIHDNEKEVFQILEGSPHVILKAMELLEKTESEVKIFTPDSLLAMFYNSDFFDTLEQRSFDVSISLLIENSLKSKLICEQLGWATQSQCTHDVEGLPCFMVTDKKMLLTIYKKKSEEKGQRRKKTKVVGLWTNCSALVDSMLMLFSRLEEQKKSR